MSHIIELCEQIISRMTSIGSPIAKCLQPGLSMQAIKAIEHTLPFVFPTSLVDMYRWHNGVSSSHQVFFFPWWRFDSIDDSVRRYKVLATPADEWWNSHWFPIFSTSDISSIGIVCKNCDTVDGEIVRAEYTLEANVEYSGLEQMLKVILAAYEMGVIFMGSDGEIDRDTELWKDHVKRLNSKTKY